MYYDVKAGKRLEIDALNGAIVKLAHEKGVTCRERDHHAAHPKRRKRSPRISPHDRTQRDAAVLAPPSLYYKFRISLTQAFPFATVMQGLSAVSSLVCIEQAIIQGVKGDPMKLRTIISVALACLVLFTVVSFAQAEG